MINVVLCGGSGTRLWPLSRKMYPKQFCKIIDNESLFQKTLKRNSQICKKSVMVTNKEQYFIAQEQLKEVFNKEYQFLLEPIGRNTAPAITLACLALNMEDIVLVTPSDHLIKNEDAYYKVLEETKKLAIDGTIVTLGLVPDYPETGFGYIQAEGNDVISFKEKPDVETAKKFLEKGNYLWNSGIFIFKVSTYLDELKKHSNDIYNMSEIAFNNIVEKDPLKIKIQDMLNIPANSIDYAVMEKSKKIKVIPANIGWSDLGNFQSLHNNLPQNRERNVISEKDIMINSSDNLILSEERIVTVIDVEDLVVVDTSDALLISKKGSSHKVKEITALLEKKQSSIINQHAKVQRPWGFYVILEEGDGFKVKKIIVKPGAKLSLQKHYHRNEHWTVVCGIAKVTLKDKEDFLKANESTYIPLGEIHRLENIGKEELVVIETQIGDYLGEDDIVRIEDDYQRNKKY